MCCADIADVGTTGMAREEGGGKGSKRAKSGEILGARPFPGEEEAIPMLPPRGEARPKMRSRAYRQTDTSFPSTSDKFVPGRTDGSADRRPARGQSRRPDDASTDLFTCRHLVRPASARAPLPGTHRVTP